MNKSALLCRAFESASVEVLECLKDLHAENKKLRSLLRNEFSCSKNKDTLTSLRVESNSTETDQKNDSRDLNLEELLDLCASQATEISRLKRKLQNAEDKCKGLERDMLTKDDELQRLGDILIKQNEENSKQDNIAKNLETCGTQTDDESPLYLPVQENEQDGADENLREYPELAIFKHMFTPRSRAAPQQGIPFDASMELTMLRSDIPIRVLCPCVP